jgi:hypothetical protein
MVSFDGVPGGAVMLATLPGNRKDGIAPHDALKGCGKRVLTESYSSLAHRRTSLRTQRSNTGFLDRFVATLLAMTIRFSGGRLGVISKIHP